ncbi:MAG TPA: PH domain-containing protein [archaeon]|nr:PH domain-containing protein [archaeon]
MGQKDFELLEGEKILFDEKPLPALRKYFFLSVSMGWAIGYIFIFWVFAAMLAFLTNSLLLATTGSLAIFFILLAPIYLISGNMYNYRHYWITNKRVVQKSGFLGYSVNSVPLERVSDVIMTRSFLERIFGFGSVHIQTLAGQVSYGRKGSEVSFDAIKNPEQTQRIVLELIKKKRKEERLTM